MRVTKKVAASIVALTSVIAITGCGSQGQTLKNDEFFKAETGKWTKCPIADEQERECQYVKVPLKQGSTTEINLAVAKVPAKKPAEKKGTLVIVPGGPNASGLSMTAGLSAILPAEILDQYDIVSYDRRGVGRSGQMDCEDQPQIVEDINQYGNVGEIQNYEGIAKGLENYVTACNAKTDQLYSEAGSQVDAQDLEHIRGVLGDDKISILAYSYGTIMAQSYLKQFGAHTDKVILDSPFDPNVSGVQFVTHNDPALGFPSKFNDGVQPPKLTDAQTKAATGLKESDTALPVNQAYVCKDFSWASRLSDEAKQMAEQTPTQPGLAMTPLQQYAACSMIQSPEAVIGEAKPAEGSAKPLIIASTEDKRATLAGAQAVAARTGGQVFEVPGDRNMITGFGRPCAADTVKNYLVNGTFDASVKCPA